MPDDRTLDDLFDLPQLLLVAALLVPDPRPLLAGAAERAVTARDRQLVAVVTAHLDGDADRRDVLVRDHLSDHPGGPLATWLAGQGRR